MNPERNTSNCTWSARSSEQQGFSLIEMVIATVVVGLLLALLSQVLLQAYRLSAAAAGAMSRAVTELTEARLRSDIAEATATSDTFVWSTEPLELRLSDSIVTYLLDDGFLTRTEQSLEPDAPPPTTQRLTPASSFRWLSNGAPTVWIEWRHRSDPLPAAGASTAVTTRVEQGLLADRRPVQRLLLTSREGTSRRW